MFQQQTGAQFQIERLGKIVPSSADCAGVQAHSFLQLFVSRNRDE
jgi:hypothetical protein